MDGDVDFVGIPGERLVNRVVHDLINQMMQPQLTGRADVHSRPFAHGLHAAKNLNRVGGVVAVALAVLGFFVLNLICDRC